MTTAYTTRVHTSPCPICGETSIVHAPSDGVERYKKGDYIQDAFPTLSIADRELILTGTHQECWDLMVGTEEQETEMETADIHPALDNYEQHRTVVDIVLNDHTPVAVTEWKLTDDNLTGYEPQVFALRWNDGVANAWCEVYETLSEALSRLALLSACQESDWKLGFRDSEDWWAWRWEKFRKEATA